MKNRAIQADLGGSWFLSWPDPVLIIDSRNLEVLRLNASAHRLLTESIPLTQRAGCIAFPNASASERFRNRLENLRHVAGPTRIEVLAGESDLFAWVEFPQPDARPHVAVVTFRGQLGGKSVSDPRQDWIQAAILIGFTSLEINVAARLTGLDSEEAIASDLGISAPVLDSCIRQIFSKSGTSSREELVSQLLSFCHSRVWHLTYRLFLEWLVVALEAEHAIPSCTPMVAAKLQAQEVKRRLATETLSIANSMNYRLHQLLL